MTTDPDAMPSGSLAKRAEVAMLTLQVRSAEQEAEAAEAALAAVDPVASGVEVDQILEPLVVRRRRELDAKFNAARHVAASEIAAAHQQVAGWLADEPVVRTAVPEPDPVTEVQPASNIVPANTGFDAEGFARAFAVSFAQVIEERVPVWSAAPATRTRFWANAKHIDVLLIAAATAILGVVLAAWLV